MPEMATTRPSRRPELSCARVSARNSALVSTGFRLGWLTPAGAPGHTPWSGSHLVGSSELFDLRAAAVPQSAQVWVEANPLAAPLVSGRVTTRCDYGSSNQETFSLEGSALGASIARH
jgi:hypothetical protein